MAATEEVRVVISLHGIKTRGVWQKDLVPVFARGGFIPYVLGYGHFSAMQLMRGKNLDQKVDWLLTEYDRIRAETGCKRPSVIAHSFGTLQIACMLEKYDSVKFDKVILAAIIVSSDYRWGDMLNQRCHRAGYSRADLTGHWKTRGRTVADVRGRQGLSILARA